MADSIVPEGAPAPTIYLGFSPRVIRLLTDYRLWAGDQPQGELAHAMGGMARWKNGAPGSAGYVATPAQSHAMQVFAYKLHEVGHPRRLRGLHADHGLPEVAKQ